jgi:rubrerythrin
MDILEFAINMELEGSRYYTEQAEANKDNGLFQVFTALAQDEQKHAKMIGEMKAGDKIPQDKLEDSNAQNIFTDSAKRISEISSTPEQLDVYRLALDKEQESIELYRELSQKSKEGSALYEFLIGEETKHFNLMSDMVNLLENPKQWVESAEFGTREDY